MTQDLLVTQTDLARAMDLSRTQVIKLSEQGVVIKVGSKYDIVQSTCNYIRRMKGREGKTSGNIDGDQPDYYQERARLTKAQADRQELEVQKAQGVLVPVENVLKAGVESIVTTRNRLLGLPQKLSYELTVNDDRDDIERLMTSEIKSIMTEMEKLEGHNYSEESASLADDQEEPLPMTKKRGRPKANAKKGE